ncbi:MAG TPA: pyridoxine 5'-phosphate synthase [Bacteroidales bacterium]|nr:pyridoxine 5'-phosphate synthase [Bacteroidales bacterium]HOK98463.1 pyridoxine 5'-phosphate synthase [Bacteroidales bacterium]HPO64843.1 pyridoxine 5'-phosphate synthase [Bacteroidales bacterium]
MKTHLSVNINKIATIRNSRGGNIPNVVEAAIRIQGFGADGITVHPRPDGRHICVNDVYDLKKVITTEFNIEGNPTEKFIQLITDVVPDQVTLVPDAHDAITSNQGWDTVTHKAFLTDVVKEFKKYGIRVSIFVDPVIKMVEAAAETGADRIELYTEPYASAYPLDPQKAVAPYVEAANVAQRCGLGVNAGHDLNLQNLRYLKQNIPFLAEVSIGHALISDALYLGLENTVKAYKACLQDS